MKRFQRGPRAVIDSRPDNESSGRWITAVLLLLVLIPTALNAKALLSEFSIPIPNLNDDAFHYLLVQRASEALAARENPFDHWMPELELGFPEFFYYQHLPHLTIVLLHRLLLKRVDLFTLFNLVRYLLMVCFPLTVYWSMRRLGFSIVTGAVAAAASTLLASRESYGFELSSYLWRGFGMYTQLWAMHLSFITLACLHRVLTQGKGYVASVVAASVLALSHLVYAYMMVVTTLVLLLTGLNRTNVRARVLRLAVVGLLSAVITSYFWVPFLLQKSLLNASPYLQSFKYDSFGARSISAWLVNGDLLDLDRLPVLTLLLALGVASALFTRTPAARLALALLLVWLALFFGRHTWGRLADFLPMHEGLLFHRFIGGVHLAAILLIGLGGEWVWRQAAVLPERWRAAVPGLVLLILMIPALRERQAFCVQNTEWMKQTRDSLGADHDARGILSALRDLAPGRTYAGLPANWGKNLRFGSVYFFNLLTFHRIVAVSPPYQGLSLNSDLIWHFDDTKPAHYTWFNVRYVVAPSGMPVPAFLRRLKWTSRYALYVAETSGYADFATVVGEMKLSSRASLLSQNRNWLLSAEPAASRFVRYDYPAGKEGSAVRAESDLGPSPSGGGCPGGGRISEERVLPGRFDWRVECREAATLVLKVTYHPNWRVTIDGRPVPTFMVSPSFIALDVPAGAHEVRAEYRSPRYKTALLLLGACSLVGILCLRRRFARLDAVFSSTP